MKFCLFDAHNLVHRAKHMVSKHHTSTPYGLEEEQRYASNERIGMILHIVFNSLRKSYEKFGANHAVICFDHGSWRRALMESYKANRRVVVRTPTEQADYEMLLKAIDTLRDFFRDYTNVTVLEADLIEADDFIARWVQHHDEGFEHVIVSGDSDFKQLVRDGVDLYTPITGMLYTGSGVYYQDGKTVKRDDVTVEKYGEIWKVKLDKTGEPLVFDPRWELFEKCIRGDTSDNIPSAWPGVRTTTMQKAFYGGDLEWNNFINSTWGTGDEKVSVRERYEYNKSLIDLTTQPPEVIEVIDQTILDAMEKPRRNIVGPYFTKFCSMHGLQSQLNRPDGIMKILNTPYGK